MLTIAHNVNDMTNYVKSLVTSHNAAILEKVREIPHLNEWKRHTHTRVYTHTHTHK